ncbi:MAG: SDR family oxidoreductase, partial [Pseudomonadota bacterium]|nr:SDR family oxidoreductase [Pseudomonadota bacterium]
AVVADIRAAGGEALLFSADVTRPGSAEKLVNDAAEAFAGLDVLINNAGALVRRASLMDADDSLYDQVLNLNVRPVVMACRAAIPHFRRRGGGAIINTGSIAGRNGGGVGSGLYGGAKAFVQNFTRNLAKELAPDRVRVNAVAPGVIMTPFHERFTPAEMLETMRAAIPMGRLGTPEECVGAYLFLASGQMSGYITGQVVEVNGGQLMP